VEVSAAVLGAEDSRRLLGTDVTATGIQPVWIEVHNGTDQVLWLLRSGADPDYFSPLEVAWSAHVTMGGNTNDRIDDHFDRVAFPNPIAAGATSSGLLFTNSQPVMKVLNIDLLGNQTMIPFTLFVPVPGDMAPGSELVHRYADSELAHYEDLAELRRALEDLPCCTTVDGQNGPPLNVVFVGHLDDIGAALTRRGYRREAPGTASTDNKVFGRSCDLVVRKRAQAGASASALSVWRAPLTFRGQAVFLAQAARPVGGRFAEGKTGGAGLHPDVDEVRNLLIPDFLYSGGLEWIGFVGNTGAVPVEQPRKLPGGGAYFTDGRRVALFFSLRPLDFADAKFLDWEPIEVPRGVTGAGGTSSGAQ